MLVSMKELLQPTRQHGFAIGAFNVADNCFLRAVVDEAEATNTPAIIAIHPSEHDFVGDAFFAHVREITQRSPVPFVLHLDHGASVRACFACDSLRIYLSNGRRFAAAV